MRILLVRLREIGDVVFTTPAVRAIRRRFPEAHITYVVEPAASAIVEHNPHIDELIVAPRPGGIGRLRAELGLIRRLRAAAYDIAIDFHSGPRASILTWLSGAPVRVGYAVVGRSWMYTRLIARPRELRPRHSVENQWDLLAALDIGPPDRIEYPVEMALGDRTASALAERLARAGVHGDHRLIVMHVSAGNPFRRWPIGSFAAVAAGLAGRDPARRVVITSGPSDRQAADRVIAEAQALARAPIAAGYSSAASSRSRNFARWSIARRSTSAATAGRCISRRRATCRSSACTVRRCRRGRRRGARRSGRRSRWKSPISPCRPCDQRSCLPGDFRCLTWIQPQQVIEAAERALALEARIKMGMRTAESIRNAECMPMPTPALIAAHARPRRSAGRLEQAGLAAVFGVAAALQFSIAAAQTLLAIAIACWLALVVWRRERIEVPRFFWPLAVFAALTFVSAAFSPQPRVSFADTKQLLLFLIVPLTYRFLRGNRGITLTTVIVSVGAASAVFGIFQYGILHYDHLGLRPRGTLGHWMTYSGLLMLVIGVALARMLFGRRDRMWAALVMPALAVAVALTFTRSAWVGACAAAALLLALKDFRLLAILPIVAAAVLRRGAGGDYRALHVHLRPEQPDQPRSRGDAA